MRGPGKAENSCDKFKPSYKFAEWFEAQYGPAPTRSEYDAQQLVYAAIGELAIRRVDLAEIIEYAARRDAALKAWCAK